VEALDALLCRVPDLPAFRRRRLLTWLDHDERMAQLGRFVIDELLPASELPSDERLRHLRSLLAPLRSRHLFFWCAEAVPAIGDAMEHLCGAETAAEFAAWRNARRLDTAYTGIAREWADDVVTLDHGGIPLVPLMQYVTTRELFATSHVPDRVGR